MINVQIDSIHRSRVNENHLLVLLKEDQGERYLPVWVPKQDGEKLISAFDKKEGIFTQPYVLMARLIKIGNIKIDSIRIYNINEVNAYAKIIIASRSFFRNDDELNCSLGDAFNIAIYTKPPIFVLDSVMEKHGIYKNQYLGDTQVYHGSQVLGLDEIKPDKGDYGGEFVYATKDAVMAAAFLGTTGGVFTCSIGRDEKTGKPFICERFEGAFGLKYTGVKGAIYVLPGESFVEGIDPWVASEESVKPIDEISITDTKEYLLELAREDKLTIKYYPEKTGDIPEDDADLVSAAASSYKHSGEEVIDLVRKYHPNLLSRVMQAINEINEQDSYVNLEELCRNVPTNLTEQKDLKQWENKFRGRRVKGKGKFDAVHAYPQKGKLFWIITVFGKEGTIENSTTQIAFLIEGANTIVLGEDEGTFLVNDMKWINLGESYIFEGRVSKISWFDMELVNSGYEDLIIIKGKLQDIKKDG